ncbi:MAG: hypothetical protein SGPRY_009063 [Prymnesium sp.]
MGWHSARIFLATALLASGASHPQIQALCRWQMDESLKIYARLNSATYVTLIGSALRADINSARASQLSSAVPFIDLDDLRRATRCFEAPINPADLDLNVHPDDDADDDPPEAADAAVGCAVPARDHHARTVGAPPSDTVSSRCCGLRAPTSSSLPS